jgi:aminoglycoside phosphotransferase (APT) family kinase protein
VQRPLHGAEIHPSLDRYPTLLEEKANWQRFRPSQPLSVTEATRLLQMCGLHRATAPLAGKTVIHLELLSGGLRNTNYRVLFSGTEWSVVLRFYAHDAEVCAKEVDVLRLVQSVVPVPEVLHVEPNGLENFPPFAILEYIDGIIFRTLRRTKDQAAIAQAAAAIGTTLAAIASHQFPRRGMFAAGLEVGDWLLPGSDTIPPLIDSCLASENFIRRAGAELSNRIHKFAWQRADRLSAVDAETRLVHSDFSSSNIMVRAVKGIWQVAAVIDWEYSFSGSPVWDIGNFLRYERKDRPLVEPYFSQACIAAGMNLPGDWRGLARAVDLCSLCEILTRETLPEDVVKEIVELLRATLEDRDPQ